jgi:hypothetical protein
MLVGSSSSKRKMDDIDPYKIIATSTSGLCQTNTHSPLFLTSFITCWGRSGTPSLIYDGATTMSESKKVMNRRQPSRPAKDCLN